MGAVPHRRRQYLFRLFDPANQLHALGEFTAALALNPANPNAALLLQRLTAQETPGGTARDLDIAPDVQDIAAGLLGETQLVLSEFLALQTTLAIDVIAEATKDQMQLAVTELSDRLSEARMDVVTAEDGVQAANDERGMYDTEGESLQQQIFALQNQPLSLTDVLTTLGAAAASIAGLVTGPARLSPSRARSRRSAARSPGSRRCSDSCRPARNSGMTRASAAI